MAALARFLAQRLREVQQRAVRGLKNEPAYVAFTCAQLAQVRGEAPEVLARAAAANARTLLKLPA